MRSSLEAWETEGGQLEDETVHLQSPEEFLELLLSSMTEPISEEACCDVGTRALHHHWGRPA